MDVNLTITFDHEGPALTYGPGRDDHLSHLTMALKSGTGGYWNHIEVHPPERRGGEGLRHYTIHFFIPQMSAELYRLDEKKFWDMSGMGTYVSRLGLTNFKGEL